MTQSKAIWYRVRDYQTDRGVTIEAEKFFVFKETPCGVWVYSQYSPSHWDEATLRRYGYLKWVSKTATKRLCYPTLAEALKSFKARKLRQFQILKYQLESVEKILDHADRWENATEADFVDDAFKLVTLTDELVLFSQKFEPLDTSED